MKAHGGALQNEGRETVRGAICLREGEVLPVWRGSRIPEVEQVEAKLQEGMALLTTVRFFLQVASSATSRSRRPPLPPSAVTATSLSPVFVPLFLPLPFLRVSSPLSRSQVPALRPREYAQISKREKTVQRAYGGSRCANCVRDRIVRAFLVEEAKIVKRVRPILFPSLLPDVVLIPHSPHYRLSLRRPRAASK